MAVSAAAAPHPSRRIPRTRVYTETHPRRTCETARRTSRRTFDDGRRRPPRPARRRVDRARSRRRRLLCRRRARVGRRPWRRRRRVRRPYRGACLPLPVVRHRARAMFSEASARRLRGPIRRRRPSIASFVATRREREIRRRIRLAQSHAHLSFVHLAHSRQTPRRRFVRAHDLYKFPRAKRGRVLDASLRHRTRASSPSATASAPRASIPAETSPRHRRSAADVRATTTLRIPLEHRARRTRCARAWRR